MLFDDASDTAPTPALTVSPSPMLASASLLDTLRAKAAATLTLPPSDDALWLVPLLLPDFVLASDVVFDFWSFASSLLVPPFSSPLALALLVTTLAPSPSAE